ncbi:glycoside hydrolase [Bimuria novae-zelandiae CBS 107.79]|uniref:Glycoside hydrolase n=1 Tax=Bimuria novae-zelandiae CBS 107.79 TaxID=1447943 RepID=A0A6A5UTJ8_9PLEO|nr:glycoside hydrolase [Bimuria novae-zelandiae CBS 107.79]
MVFRAALAALAVAAHARSLNERQTSTITVDLSKTYQTMDGFAMSETFQRANQMYALSESFSILRNGIGSSPDASSDHMISIQPENPECPSAPPKYIWDGNNNSQVWVSTEAVNTYGIKTAYANYLVQYITYYKQVGVDVTHLGFLNEPNLTTSYASMRSNGQQAADFVKVLRPTLDKAKFTEVKITCCDAEGGTVRQALGPSPFFFNNGAGEGLTWALKIHDAITRANVSGATNSKLTRIANDRKSVIPSKRLWAFANWSRHVRPGAVRVAAAGGPAGARVSAFQNVDGTVAVQVIQGGAGAGRVGVKVGAFTVKSAKAWVTDNTHDCDESVVMAGADGGMSLDVPGRSMVTVVLDEVT